MKNFRFNFIVNVFDGAFFGFALGFASFITIIPLFVSNLTDSRILIGLIPAIHSVGWQLPQLLTAKTVSRQSVFKPMVMRLTIHERIPFLGLGIVAWFLPALSTNVALILIFCLLIWQGLGGGFAATAWQSMIGKIFQTDFRGTFYGAQSAAANLLAMLSAIIAGLLLDRLDSPIDFSLCFVLAFIMMAISYGCLAFTRESAHSILEDSVSGESIWKTSFSLLKQDRNFAWYLIVRMLSQIAIVGFAFYTVYAVEYLGMSELSVGILTSLLLGVQIIANPIMGWLGDRWSHKGIMEVGIISAIISGLVAWKAPSPTWFILVFITAGIAYVALWTINLAIIQEFGNDSNRPAYIGMANTYIAPFSILVPILGGILADKAGFPAVFFASVLGGLATIIILHWIVKDPRKENLESIQIPVMDTSAGDR